MSEKLGEAVLELRTDDTGVDEGFDDVERKAEKRTRQIGDKMGRVGKRLTLGVTLPLLALGGVAFNAASDLGEATDLMNRAFGENAEEVEAWSDNAAEGMGLARAEALQAASQFKLMFDEMGFGQREATDMSKSLVQLAADMGSAFNEEPVEMLDKLRSGITGEIEPLKRFGVALTATAVESKAVELGLADANGEVSEGAKVQARYALIMEKTNAVQGNYAETSDSAANMTRTARKQFVDMAAELGQTFLPIATEVLGWASKLFDAFESLPDGAQTAVVALAAVAAAIGPLLIAGGAVVRNFKAIREAATGLSSFLKRGLSPTMLGVGSVLVAGIAIWQAFRREAERNERQQRELVDAIEETGDAVDGTNDVIADMLVEYDNLRRVMVEAGVTTMELSEALNGNEDEWNAVKRQLLESADAAGVAGLSFQLLFDELGDLRNNTEVANEVVAELDETVVETGEDAGPAGEALDAMGDDVAELADEANQGAQMLDALKREIDSILGPTLDAEAAMLRYRDSVDELIDEVAVAGQTLDENTKAGRDNRQAILDSTDAAFSFAEALARQTGDTGRANELLDDHVAQLRDVMEQAGLSEDEIDAYLETLGLTPDNIETVIDNTAAEAAGEVDDYRMQSLDAIAAKIRTEVEADTGQATSDLQKVVDKINDITSLANVTVRTAFGVAGAQHGGIFGNHQIIEIAEHGRPEAVVPLGGNLVESMDRDRVLDSAGIFGRRGGDINIRVEGSVVTEGRLIDVIREGIRRRDAADS